MDGHWASNNLLSKNPMRPRAKCRCSLTQTCPLAKSSGRLHIHISSLWQANPDGIFTSFARSHKVTRRKKEKEKAPNVFPNVHSRPISNWAVFLSNNVRVTGQCLQCYCNLPCLLVPYLSVCCFSSSEVNREQAFEHFQGRTRSSLSQVSLTSSSCSVQRAAGR